MTYVKHTLTVHLLLLVASTAFFFSTGCPDSFRARKNANDSLFSSTHGMPKKAHASSTVRNRFVQCGDLEWCRCSTASTSSCFPALLLRGDRSDDVDCGTGAGCGNCGWFWRDSPPPPLSASPPPSPPSPPSPPPTVPCSGSHAVLFVSPSVSSPPSPPPQLLSPRPMQKIPYG